MKNVINRVLVSTCCLLALAMMSCEKNDQDIIAKTIIEDDLITVPLFIEDENGEVPIGDTTMLFETRTHNPVVDRDGKQLSLAEFSTVKGTVLIEQMEGGTKVSLNLTGLIPNALYTIWNATFTTPGFDPTAEGMNLIGLGVVGKSDGSENYFRASANGTGHISAFTPGGPLSMVGEISEHPFSQEVEWHLVGAYHLDDQSHGPDLGPDGTVVEQFAFVFKN